jgi:flagellar biosynthetic protein FlhB
MAEKTEAPTGRRLSEARREGQVAQSQELNAAASLLVGGWLLNGPGKKLLFDFQGMLISTVSTLPKGEISIEWVKETFINDILRIGADFSAIVIILGVTGVSITLGQTGFLWASKRLGIDLNRVNPLSGLKRLFSAQGLVELLKSLLKLLVVGWVSYGFLRNRAVELMGLSQTDLISALTWWASMVISLMSRVGGAYLILAILDYTYQRWHHQRSLRMTKEEIREEYKQTEGDPVIKGRVRSAMRRMARMRMMANVPKADVVITNPTHLAIAIKYEPETMKAPKVLAKGAHLVAERIVASARAHGVPVIQNIPLARAIYKLVDLEQEIPSQLYVAMAELLAYVYRLKGITPLRETETAPS